MTLSAKERSGSPTVAFRHCPLYLPWGHTASTSAGQPLRPMPRTVPCPGASRSPRLQTTRRAALHAPMAPSHESSQESDREPSPTQASRPLGAPTGPPPSTTLWGWDIRTRGDTTVLIRSSQPPGTWREPHLSPQGRGCTLRGRARGSFRPKPRQSRARPGGWGTLCE